MIFHSSSSRRRRGRGGSAVLLLYDVTDLRGHRGGERARPELRQFQG